jgi:peptide/nickel transport system substrate-binding protein
VSKEEHRLVDDFLAGRMSRRDLVKGLMAAGISATAMGSLLGVAGFSPAEASSIVEAPTRIKRGGTVRFSTEVPAADVDPITMFNEGAIFTAEMSLEHLVFPRANGSLEPKLATSWHSTNPAVWTFNLRKGVKWQDGKPFTSADVVHTFDLLTSANSGALSAYKGVLSHGHVRANGPHQVTFHLDRAYVDFPYLVSAFTYNSVIVPKGYKVGDFVKGGIGTGPFVLTKYTPKVGATYKANKHYWARGKPYVDGAQLKYYADNSSQVLAIQAGAIDVFLDAPYQGSQALFSNSKVKVLSIATSSYREFHMRVDQKPFDDARVRQAVALCLDRPAIIQALWNGKAAIGNDHPFAPVYPTSKLAIQKIPQRKQDYTQAKKLLAAAGYPNGFDVTLTTENFLEIPQYAQIIQQQLKPAGINVKLNVEDQNTYYGSGSNQPWLDVPFGIVDWSARGSASQLITPAYLSGGVWNSAHWKDPKFDKLMGQYDKELNPTKRAQIALNAAKEMHDQTPAIIAYWIKELRAIRKNVHGLPINSFAYVDPTPVWLS